MNIIQIAEESGFKRETTLTYGYPYTAYKANIERFAALVAAHEREKFQTYVDQVKFDREASVLDAVLAEREACAVLCLQTGIKHPQQTGQEACAAAIRARGDK